MRWRETMAPTYDRTPIVQYLIEIGMTNNEMLIPGLVACRKGNIEVMEYFPANFYVKPVAGVGSRHSNYERRSDLLKSQCTSMHVSCSACELGRHRQVEGAIRVVTALARPVVVVPDPNRECLHRRRPEQSRLSSQMLLPYRSPIQGRNGSNWLRVYAVVMPMHSQTRPSFPLWSYPPWLQKPLVCIDAFHAVGYQ